MAALVVNLDDRHSEVLAELALEQGISRSALMRQALRLYQLVHEHGKKGECLAFRRADGTYVEQVVVGLGDLR